MWRDRGWRLATAVGLFLTFAIAFGFVTTLIGIHSGWGGLAALVVAYVWGWRRGA